MQPPICSSIQRESVKRFRHIKGAALNPMVKMIALCLIISICLIVIWNQLFGGKIPEVFNAGFQCSECQETFVMTNVELRTVEIHEATLESDRMRTPDQPHCPKCNGKHTGMLMVECPSCKHYYLPSKVNLRANPNAQVPPPVCPKCGTDRNKWISDHAS